MSSSTEPHAAGTVLAISGMTCAACVRGVSSALSRVPGVTRVEVNLDTGLAIAEGSADPGALVAAAERAGYGARLA